MKELQLYLSTPSDVLGQLSSKKVACGQIGLCRMRCEAENLLSGVTTGGLTGSSRRYIYTRYSYISILGNSIVGLLGTYNFGGSRIY